jgi:hypothetical protein
MRFSKVNAFERRTEEFRNKRIRKINLFQLGIVLLLIGAIKDCQTKSNLFIFGKKRYPKLRVVFLYFKTQNKSFLAHLFFN